MFEDLRNFFKNLEEWERYQSSSFWGCTIGLYLSFSAGFGVLFPESPSQSHVVIEQVQSVPKTNSTNIDEVILVKNNGILPGADGFTITPSRRHPVGPPRMKGTNGIFAGPPKSINGNIPGRAPTVRPTATDLNAKRRNKGDQCPSSKINMEREFETFKKDMAKKGLEVKCDQERFNELSVNPQTGKVDEKSIFEVKGGLQLEAENRYGNIRRPRNPKVDLDFEATDLKTGEEIFLDMKGLIDFQSLADQGKDISHFPSHELVAYRIGQGIPPQKGRFVGIDNGPKSPKQVHHVVDFDNIRNPSEKPNLVSAVINGAEDASGGDRVGFINYE